MSTPSHPSSRSQSTFRALVTEDKPKRGRPKHAIPRESVYVELSLGQKTLLTTLGDSLPVTRADIPDMAVMICAKRFDAMRRAIAERERELPEGITDLDSLYYLWDLELEKRDEEKKWTSVRLSPNQVVELGRLHGTFNALFKTTRSDVFSLALSLLTFHFRRYVAELPNPLTIDAFDHHLDGLYASPFG